jgi:hypothetical protein
MFQRSRGADHACAIFAVDKLSIFYDPDEAWKALKVEA